MKVPMNKILNSMLIPDYDNEIKNTKLPDGMMGLVMNPFEVKKKKKKKKKRKKKK